MDVWLLIVTIVTPFVLLFLNTLILARYVDSAHAKGHWVAKFVIILGLTLAESAVLVIPLDVVRGPFLPCI